MLQKIKYLINSHRTFALYSLIGISGVVLDFIAFLFLYNILGVNPIFATILSVFLGITNNFILNALYNFKKTDKIMLRFLAFVVVGVSGLVLSTYILAFGEVFAINANLMKLVSLPVIVFYQYFLNKAVSFRTIQAQTSLVTLIKTFIKNNWGLLLLNFAFIIFTLSFVKSIPFLEAQHWLDTAPDEVGHFRYNTEFMLRYNRLPISGKDDIEAYESCQARDYGKVPCSYSYVVYPAANYVFSAVTSKVVTSIVDISPLKGARLSSVIWGVVFLNFLYLISHRITGRRAVAWAIASLALIPQVVFTFSYLNQDAHSLGISAIVIYALVSLVLNSSRRNIILAGLSFGALLPLAKYNYFILIPVTALLLSGAVILRKLPLAALLKVTVASLVAFLAFSAFWYIRNFVLYEDVLGQSFVISEMAKYAPLGNEIPFTRETIETYTNMNFFELLFKSFFLTFGSMAHFMTPERYAIIQAVLVAMLGGYLYIAYKTSTKKTAVYLIGALGVFLVTLVGSVGLVLYNSLIYDFQPQGRYLYPILALFTACLAYAYNKNHSVRWVIIAMMFIIGYLIINAIDIYLRVYIA